MKKKIKNLTLEELLMTCNKKECRNCIFYTQAADCWQTLAKLIDLDKEVEIDESDNENN